MDGLPFPAPLSDGFWPGIDSFLPVASRLKGAGAVESMLHTHGF